MTTTASGGGVEQIIREMRNEGNDTPAHIGVSPLSVLHWADRLSALSRGEPVAWASPTSLQWYTQGSEMRVSMSEADYRAITSSHPNAARGVDEAHTLGFYDGVLLALQVLNAGGDCGDAHYEELVNCVGGVKLVKRAKAEGMMELSGLSKYLKQKTPISNRIAAELRRRPNV